MDIIYFCLIDLFIVFNRNKIDIASYKEYSMLKFISNHFNHACTAGMPVLYAYKFIVIKLSN